MGAAAAEDGGEGAEEDLEVEPEGPVVDVGEVEGDPFFEVFDAVAAGDLPEAGEAGFDAEAAALGVFFDAFDFVDGEGAGADEAHFAAEDVEELGEFVDAEAAEPGAEGEDAGVVADFEDGAVHFVLSGEFLAHGFGVGVHGAEFPHHEGLAIASGAFLAEKDGAGRGEANADEGDDPKGDAEDEEDSGANAVESVFKEERPGDLRGAVEDEHEASGEGVEGGAGDGGLEEVGGDPGFDAFGFAGLDGFFDAGEVDVLGGEEDAADGMLMHGGHQGFDRVLGEVDAGADVDFGAVFVAHGFEEAIHVLGEAGDEDGFATDAGVDAATEGNALAAFAQEDGEDAEGEAEDEDGATGDLPADEDGEGTNDHADDDQGLKELADGAGGGFADEIRIETAAFEDDGGEGDDDGEEPEGLTEGRDGAEVGEEVEGEFGAEVVAEPQEKCQKTAVGEFCELQIDFLSPSEHSGGNRF